MAETRERLARRARRDPHFLAFALAEYAAAEELDDATLAGRLGCTADGLFGARLCPAPRADAEGFAADVTRIAGRFGLDRDRLAEAAKHGQVVLLMRGTPSAPAGGVYMAARDGDE